MEIPINLIKPSPNPVRTQWDKDKMNELAQSIKEQGLIVPIKIRVAPDVPYCTKHGWSVLSLDNPYVEDTGECLACGDIISHVWELLIDYHPEPFVDEPVNKPYEIVYGHRRAEACKRVELKSIEAIVEYLKDDAVIIQALIENIQREDMTPLDKAMAIRAIKQSNGWNNQDLERAGLMGNNQAKYLDTYVEEYESGHLHKILINEDFMSRADGVQHAVQVKTALPHSPDDRKAVLDKVADENLSYRQARQVADSVAVAPTDQAKKKLLEWEYSPTIHDPELIKERTKTHGAHDPIYRDDSSSPQKQFDDTPETRAMVDGFTMALTTFTQLMQELQKMSTVGKLAPEGKQFMAHKLRSFRDKINTLINELEMTDG